MLVLDCIEARLASVVTSRDREEPQSLRTLHKSYRDLDNPQDCAAT